MALFKTIAIIVLSISAFVFIVLFGRLPAFRKTPVGFLYRVIMKHIPAGFVRADTSITGGRVARSLQRTINYFMYEKHPTVLIFFLILQLASEILIIPILLPTLTPLHYILLPTLITLPYLFLHLCATTTSLIPIPPTILNQPHSPTHPPPNLNFGSAHQLALRAYPYDYTLFHPGFFCPTCHIPKPARSKHCSLCKGCVQKMDHHCIWINNCVGRNNHLYFLLLVFSTLALLIYGAILGYGYMWDMIQQKVVPKELVRGSKSAKRWSTGLSWWRWVDAFLWACSVQPRVGGVTLLSLLCVPLAGGFGVYHAYLVWAGSTTNEQGKWGDWREDVGEGLVWRSRVEGVRGGALPREVLPRDGDIPDARGGLKRAEWWYIRTRGGEQPMRKEGGIDERWERVTDWKVVENLYDQGWWNNLMEVFWDRDR